MAIYEISDNRAVRDPEKVFIPRRVHVEGETLADGETTQNMPEPDGRGGQVDVLWVGVKDYPFEATQADRDLIES